jgi:tRNA dimethylallyltransferase
VLISREEFDQERGNITTPVLFIVGPTGVGKTSLALSLARRFRGEIINADSRQVYRLMDIGTAKPTPEERAQVQHHLLDIRDPDDNIDLACFLSLAKRPIAAARGQGHLPIAVGGTGQYIWALLEGWEVPEVAPDLAFREAKQREAQQHGPPFVHHQLAELDPDRAAALDPRNLRRVIRALEIYRSTQRRPSGLAKQAKPMPNTMVIGLTLDREALYQRIDERVDQMMAAGFLEEVQRLASQGYEPGQGPLAGPGYRELGHYLAGHMPLDEAVQRTKFQTHRLARRQYTWFKLDDPRIKWLEADGPDLEDRAAALVEKFLSAA